MEKRDRWSPGITYRNLYESGTIGQFICPDRDTADSHVRADNMAGVKRVAVIRITAKQVVWV